MGDFLALIIIVFIVSALSSNSKKKKAMKKKATVLPAEAFGGQNAPKAKSVQAREPMIHLYDPAQEKQVEARRNAVAQPDIAPRVAPHVHVTPHRPDMFAGSMNAETHEGEDPCHEEQLNPVKAPRLMAPVQQEEPGLSLEWTGESMVRAFVMQEVLQRPCDRRKRMGSRTVQ